MPNSSRERGFMIDLTKANPWIHIHGNSENLSKYVYDEIHLFPLVSRDQRVFFRIVDTGEKNNNNKHRSCTRYAWLRKTRFSGKCQSSQEYMVAGKCRQPSISMEVPNRENVSCTTDPKNTHAVYHSVLDQWRIVHAPVAVEQISLELPVISVDSADTEHRCV